MKIGDVKRALVKKLNAKPVGGKRHDRFAVFDPDKPNRKLFTVGFSRGESSIDDDSLLRHIAVNELHLRSLGDFKDFVACTLDGPTALEIIRSSVSR